MRRNWCLSRFWHQFHTKLGSFALQVAKTSQRSWVPLTGNDNPDDAHTSHSGDVTDDLGQFDVHWLEGFLHVLDMSRTIPNQIVAMSRQGTQGANLFRRAKGGSQ